MKTKKIISTILVFLLLITTSLFISCDSNNGGGPSGGDTPEVLTPAVSLNYKDISIYENDPFTLVATVSNSEDVVEWISSDESIVTVDSNGSVTGLKVGTAVVIAKIKEAMATCNVTVEEANVFDFSNNEIKDEIIECEL